MNYDTPTTPRPQNFGRFSSRFFFTPGTNLNPLSVAAGTLWMDLGNCTSSQQKHGAKSADVMRARRGGNSRVDAPVTDVSPEMDITVNEVRVRKTIPVRIFGTQGTDVVQAAVTAQTLSVAAVMQNSVIDLGKRNVANVTVKIGSSSSGTAAIQDTDFQLDPVFGTVTIMEGAIPDSTTMTPSPVFITFDCAALTRASFQEYTNLNTYGLLRWFLEDTYAGGAAVEKIAYVNLKPQDAGADDPGKYRDDKLTAVILGNVARFERKD